jgi:cell wall-associated NlpC family hydrolase
MIMMRQCPICHSKVPFSAKKCRHCHNYLGFSFQWVWEEGVRGLSLLATIAAALVAWKSLQFTMVAQNQREQAMAQTALSYQERDALKEDLDEGTDAPNILSQAATVHEKELVNAAEKSSDLRVRQVLEAALSLKKTGVKFRMGGKSPEEGFDSSGFVSFLLAKAGVLDPLYQRTFSVAKLEKSLPEIDSDKVKPGDLVFLGKSFVAIHLEGHLAVGIGNNKGIQVFSFFPKARVSYRRWAYEEDSKMIR